MTKLFSAAVVSVVALVFSPGLRAAEFKILCAGGMKEVVSDLKPQLEKALGRAIAIDYGEAGDLKKRILDGEAADLIVLPKVVLNEVLAQGKAIPNSVVDLAQTATGIGVRADMPKPDISTGEGLKRTLLAAKKIAMTDPDSGGVAGVYVGQVIQKLGIADQIKPKLILTRVQRNAEYVASGEADVAIQLAHEIRIVPGIVFIPLPPEFERVFVFSAAIGSNSGDMNAAKTLMAFLSGGETRAKMLEKRMDLAQSK